MFLFIVLPVTRRAIRQVSSIFDIVFCYQARSDLVLIRRRSLIGGIEHLVPRAHVPFRIAVAVDAPLHIERIYLVHERHRVHPAVARGAADTLVYVNTVVEVDEVGQVVNARPLDRPARADPEAPRWSRYASGSSCTSQWVGVRRSPKSQQRCGSTGSRCHRQRHGAYD